MTEVRPNLRQSHGDDAEPLSPELVLVSDELREHALALLPDDPADARYGSSRDTAAGSGDPVQTTGNGIGRALAAPRLGELEREQARDTSDIVRRRPRKRARRVLQGFFTLVFGAALMAVLLALVGAESPRDGGSAAAPQSPVLLRTVVPSQKSANVPAGKLKRQARQGNEAVKRGRPTSSPSERARRRRATKRRQSVPQPARVPAAGPALRWPRVAEASYYYFQLIRGKQKLLDLWPTRPSLRLPTRWTYGDFRYRLVSGSYRWHVYPGFGRPAELRLGGLLKRGVLVVPRRTDG